MVYLLLRLGENPYFFHYSSNRPVRQGHGENSYLAMRPMTELCEAAELVLGKGVDEGYPYKPQPIHPHNESKDIHQSLARLFIIN
jgi:hypothetical protein